MVQRRTCAEKKRPKVLCRDILERERQMGVGCMLGALRILFKSEGESYSWIVLRLPPAVQVFTPAFDSSESVNFIPRSLIRNYAYSVMTAASN